MSTDVPAVPPGTDPIDLLGSANYIDFGNAILTHPAWSWSEPWWQQGCLICRAISGQLNETWEQKDHRQVVPGNLDRLGCSGHDPEGRLYWIGFDLDVMHGTTSYSSLDEALADAQLIREELGEAEVRLSTSGNGVHVRHLLPEDSGLTRKESGRIAKYVARKLNIKADPSSLGRQAHWLWSRAPSERSYELIAEQTEPVLDLADIIVEALASSTCEGERGAWSGDSIYDPALADDDAERDAIAHWEPAGEFSGRSPLGDRNWCDMRYLVNDWGISIPRALEILRGRGANVHPRETQWLRMMQYTRYPQGWARWREARKRQPQGRGLGWGLLGYEGGVL